MIVVDRIEGRIAVLEVDGHAVEFPASALPAGATEGSILQLQLDGGAQRDLQADNRARLERLRARDPARGGVLKL